MVANPARRAALTDAGLQVLAESGARGLTHRAVDRVAALPLGTAANYFPSREELLGALGNRIFERLTPDPARLQQFADRPAEVALLTDYVRDIVARATEQPTMLIALLELRLEATRRPALATILRATLEQGFRADVDHHRQRGLPGGQREIALLHYCIDGLLLDRLTVPITDVDLDEVIAELVRRLVT